MLNPLHAKKHKRKNRRTSRKQIYFSCTKQLRKTVRRRGGYKDIWSDERRSCEARVAHVKRRSIRRRPPSSQPGAETILTTFPVSNQLICHIKGDVGTCGAVTIVQFLYIIVRSVAENAK